MHLFIKVKSPNNISKWHMGFNSAFKGLKQRLTYDICRQYDVCKGAARKEIIVCVGCST
jgi:hypothetical protein